MSWTLDETINNSKKRDLSTNVKLENLERKCFKCGNMEK